MNNLSVRLADLGRREEALGAIEEAVAIRRRLAAARPAVFGGELARSLVVRALRREETSKRDDAREDADEALALLDPLIAAGRADLGPLRDFAREIRDRT